MIGERNYEDHGIELATAQKSIYVLTYSYYPKYSTSASARDIGIYAIDIESGYKSYFNYIGSACDDIPISIKANFKGVFILASVCFPLMNTFNGAINYTSTITGNAYTQIMITTSLPYIVDVTTFSLAAKGTIGVYSLPSEGGLLDFLVTSNSNSSFIIEYIKDFYTAIGSSGEYHLKINAAAITKAPPSAPHWVDYTSSAIAIGTESKYSSIEEYVHITQMVTLMGGVYIENNVKDTKCSNTNRYIYKSTCLPECPSYTYEGSLQGGSTTDATLYIEPYTPLTYGMEFTSTTQGLYQKGIFANDASVSIPELTVSFWVYVNSNFLTSYTLVMIYNAIIISESSLGFGTTSIKLSAISDSASVTEPFTGTKLNFGWRYIQLSYKDNGYQFLYSVKILNTTGGLMNPLTTEYAKPKLANLNFKNFIFFGGDYNPTTGNINNNFVGFIKEFRIFSKYHILSDIFLQSPYSYSRQLLAFYHFNENKELNLEGNYVSKYIDYSIYSNVITFVINTTTPQVSSLPTFTIDLKVYELYMLCTTTIDTLDEYNIDDISDGDATTIHRVYNDLQYLSLLNSVGATYTIVEFRNGRCNEGTIVDTCVIQSLSCVLSKLASWSNKGGKHFELCIYDSGSKSSLLNFGQIYLYDRPKFFEVAGSSLYMGMDTSFDPSTQLVPHGGDVIMGSTTFYAELKSCISLTTPLGNIGDVCWSSVGGTKNYVVIPNSRLTTISLFSCDICSLSGLGFVISQDIALTRISTAANYDDNYTVFLSSGVGCNNRVSNNMVRKNGFFPYFYCGNGIFAVKNCEVDLSLCDLNFNPIGTILSSKSSPKITPEIVYIYPSFDNPSIVPNGVIVLQFNLAIKFAGSIIISQLNYNTTNIVTISTVDITNNNKIVINTTAYAGMDYSLTIGKGAISDTLSQAAVFFSGSDFKLIYHATEFTVSFTPISISYKKKEIIVSGTNFMTFTDPLCIYSNNKILYRTFSTNILAWIDGSYCHPILYANTDDSSYSETSLKVMIELNDCTSGKLYANFTILRHAESTGCSSASCVLQTVANLSLIDAIYTMRSSVDYLYLGTVNCAESCLTCNSNDCILCDSSSTLPYLYAGICVASCPTSFPYASQYSQFVDDISHTGYSCTSACTSHQFYNTANKYCQSCSSSCLTCKGPNNDDCLSCYGTVGSAMYLYQGVCLTACPAKTTLSSFSCLPNSDSSISISIKSIGAKSNIILRDADVILTAIINSATSAITSIEWSVYPYQKSINEDTSSSRLFYEPSKLNEVSIRLNPYYFSSYDYSKEVSITVTVSSIDASSIKMINLKSIDPPIIGNFDVSPTIGTAMSDLFTISLSNWKLADDVSLSLTYMVDLVLGNGVTVNIIPPTTTPPSSVKVLIPMISLGTVVLDATLVAKVFNDYGGMSQSPISVQIKNSATADISTSILSMITSSSSRILLQSAAFTVEAMNSLQTTDKLSKTECVLSSDCLNDGECNRRDDNAFMCDCASGFSGNWCQFSSVNKQVATKLTDILIASFITQIASPLTITDYTQIASSLHALLGSLPKLTESLSYNSWKSSISIFNALYVFASTHLQNLYNLNMIEGIVYIADDLLSFGSILYSDKFINHTDTSQTTLSSDDYTQYLFMKVSTESILSSLSSYINSLTAFTSTASSVIEISASMFTASIYPYSLQATATNNLLAGYVAIDSATLTSLLSGPQEIYVKLIDWKVSPYYYAINSSAISHMISLSLLTSAGAEIAVKDIASALNIVFAKSEYADDLQCVYYNSTSAHNITTIDKLSVQLSNLTTLSDADLIAYYPEITASIRKTNFNYTKFIEANKTVTGGFSNDGCTKAMDTPTSIVCRCNHLTDIAISKAFNSLPIKQYLFYTSYNPIVTFKSSLGFYLAYILLMIFGILAVVAIILDVLHMNKYIDAMLTLRGKRKGDKEFNVKPQNNNFVTEEDCKTQNVLLDVTKRSDISDNSLVNFTSNLDNNDRLSALNSDKEIDLAPTKSVANPRIDLPKDPPKTPPQNNRHTGQYKQKSGKKISLVEQIKIKAKESNVNVSIGAKSKQPTAHSSNISTNENKMDVKIMNILNKTGTLQFYTDYYSMINEGYLTFMENSKKPMYLISKLFHLMNYYSEFQYKKAVSKHMVFINMIKVISLSLSRVARVLICYTEVVAYLMWTYVLMSSSLQKVYKNLPAPSLNSFDFKYIWAPFIAWPLSALTAFIPSMILKVRVNFVLIFSHETLVEKMY